MEFEHFVVLSPAILIALGLIIGLAWRIAKDVVNNLPLLRVLQDSFVGASWMGATFGTYFGLKNSDFYMYLLVLTWWYFMTWGAYRFASRIHQLEQSVIPESTCSKPDPSLNCKDGNRENAD
ncbi:hypothetical protein [Hydrogenophaga sp. NFH-34]|uniref:hypothetical protein n=1 Tax=Hydrogenophaga sp. NFH-34 TaxID=2744446 RepID=UPI001F3F20EA|nr:hypothetical protein [Hydrogenophaga sp. NFH-34]